MRPYQALTDEDTVLRQERGLAAVLCTPRRPASAPGDSVIYTGDWFLCYISAAASRKGNRGPHQVGREKSRSRWGSVGSLGLLVGPQRKVRKRTAGVSPTPSRGLLPVMEGEVATTLPYEVFHRSEVHVWI